VTPLPSETRGTKAVAAAPSRETTLYAAVLNEIAVARTEEAFDRFLKTAAKNDRYGYAELAMTGDVFLVPSGTKVLILDYRFAKHHVRILEGPSAGAS
jgi:hypothetical protein